MLFLLIHHRKKTDIMVLAHVMPSSVMLLARVTVLAETKEEVKQARRLEGPKPVEEAAS